MKTKNKKHIRILITGNFQNTGFGFSTMHEAYKTGVTTQPQR